MGVLRYKSSMKVVHQDYRRSSWNIPKGTLAQNEEKLCSEALSSGRVFLVEFLDSFPNGIVLNTIILSDPIQDMIRYPVLWGLNVLHGSLCAVCFLDSMALGHGVFESWDQKRLTAQISEVTRGHENATVSSPSRLSDKGRKALVPVPKDQIISCHLINQIGMPLVIGVRRRASSGAQTA